MPTRLLRRLLVVLSLMLAAAPLVPPGTAPGGGVAEVGAAFPGANGRIAFASNRVTANNPEGDFEIFTMKSDGTGIRQLTDNAENDFEPAWSPDGAQIAFGSFRDGNAEIYTMNADGSNQTRRTTDPAFDVRPDWQPRP